MIIILFLIFYVIIFIYIIPITLTSLRTRFNLYDLYLSDILKLNNFFHFLQNIIFNFVKNEKLAKILGGTINFQTLVMLLRFSLLKKLK